MTHPGVPSLTSISTAQVNSGGGMLRNHVDHQQQCFRHWFHLWGPYNKQDFLKFLVNRTVGQTAESLFEAMDDMKIKDRPPSIMQCQLKLIGQWLAEWTDAERSDIMEWIAATDPAFFHTFQLEVAKRQGQQL